MIRDPGPPQERCAKRNRNCRCCGGRLVREQRPAPKPDDPHYKIAVCPACDLTPAPTIPWTEGRPPASF